MAQCVNGDQAPAMMQGGSRSTARHRATRPPGHNLSAARNHNLPAPHTHLIGREQDSATVRGLVLHAPGRLVTLTGTGGCGKTQLALLVAAGLVEAFSDGVWLIELSTVQAPQLVPYAMAAALGRRERPGEALLDTLVAHLRKRNVLLVLDNCEHLIDACADLAERLLSSCPMLHLLATSREQLRMGGEVTWRVPSLPSPDPLVTLPPTDLLEYPAVRLFVDRVTALQPDFALGATNASSIAGICSRLEGLPLAIELAAARVPALSLPQILERLDDTVRLLVGGSRTAPTRQQTLRATLDWSYGLLDMRERAVFCRMAVFAGDCGLDAVEAVCDGGDVAAADVLDVLHHLIDKSLVLAEEQAGQSRYRLLEPVRQYAREQLSIRGDLVDARRAHALFFLAFGEHHERATNVGGPERPAATAALLREYANIRLALGWSLESGEVQVGLRLARAVQFLWQARGYPGEGLEWLERLLMLPGAEEPTRGRAVGLLCAGRLAAMLGNLAEARTFLEPGLPLASSIDDPWVQWLGRQNFAFYSWMCGDFDSANGYQREALAIARGGGDRIDEAVSLTVFAWMATNQGQYAEAQTLADDARELAHTVGEQWSECLALVQLGSLAMLRGDHAAARSDFDRGLDLGRQQGDPYYTALAIEGLGRAALVVGEHDEAFGRLAESLHILDEGGHRPDIADTLESFAAFAAQLSEPELALQLAGSAAVLRETIGVPQSPLRRDLLQRWLPAVRPILGEDASARNWAIGQAMTILEAIEVALSLHESVMPRSQPRTERTVLPSGLTSRETEVLRLLAKGQSNKEIAAELVISVNTVQRHVGNILYKTGSANRTQVASYAHRAGIV
jgi:predicted ATPase/DNA-binding CsgD family transcriptional regulator